MMNPVLALKAFFGMVGLSMMPGLVVLQIRYYYTRFTIWKKRENLFLNFDQEKMELSFWRSQVAQVLLTLPYSFSQMGMLSGIILQIFYGFLGSWTAYLISVLYVEYRSRKEKENVSFKNHVIQVSLPRTTPNIRTKQS